MTASSQFWLFFFLISFYNWTQFPSVKVKICFIYLLHLMFPSFVPSKHCLTNVALFFHHPQVDLVVCQTFFFFIFPHLITFVFCLLLRTYTSSHISQEFYFIVLVKLRVYYFINIIIYNQIYFIVLLNYYNFFIYFFLI